VRYAFAAIALACAAVIAAAFALLAPRDAWFVAFAAATVVFFGAIPIVLGVLSRRSRRRTTGGDVVVIGREPSPRHPPS
jgi:ACR3 family arsenite efflux pump ArsB